MRLYLRFPKGISTTARPTDRRGLNAGVAALVEQLIEVGPDIPTVARRLGQYKETVRYRYKKLLLERGMPLQVNVDHERLGLQRAVVVLEFTETYKAYANNMLVSMNETCYVYGFERTLVEGFYVVQVDVPKACLPQFRSLFRKLEAEGVFRIHGFHTFDILRTNPMRAEFYDFVNNRWDYDWSAVTASNKSRLDHQSFAVPEPARLDYYDLLVLKELQVDAARPISAIAEKLRLNLKTLHWHFRKHVIGNGLIRNYQVRWLGTRYEPRTERIFHKKHRYLRVDILTDALTDAERMELVAVANGIPFLWAEAIGKGYYAQFAFPVEGVVEAYAYLGRILSKLHEKVRMYVMDQTNAVNFTISYSLFDEEKRCWRFDDDVVSKYLALAQKIREGGRA